MDQGSDYGVKLFASLREAVGTNEVTVSLPAGSTAGDLLQAVAAAHPEIERQRGVLNLAIDRVICGPDRVLTPGAEVALLPPVGGG